MIAGIALSPALDVTYVVERLSGIQRPLDVVRVGGGKTLNAARAARALGAPRVAASAALAGGAGADIAAHARSQGLDLRVVDGQAPTRTCVSIFDRDASELTEIYERPSPLSDDEADAVVDAALLAGAGGHSWFLLSGGIAPEQARRAVARVRESGGAVAVDTHGAALPAAIDEGAGLVKVNRSEAVELLECAPDARGQELVVGLHARLTGSAGPDGPPIAIVTDGTDGAWAFDGRRVLRAPAIGPVGGFPVGSGDSFLGGLVTAIDAGGALPDALALATAAGVANAQLPGAAVLDGAWARDLAKRIEIEQRASNALR